MSTVLIALGAALALVVLAVLAVVTRIKVAGPNEAFIITGRKGQPVTNPETGVVSTDLSGQKIVMGSSVFVLPFVQKLSALDLSSRRLNVAIRGAVSATGIKVDLEGEAEAAATRARGAAEAQALDEKAKAFAQFSDAAVLDLLVRVLPDVVREASAPLGNVDKLTIISTDGASDLTRTVARNVEQGMQIGSDLTGVDVSALLRRLGSERVG